jgi:PAS domain S-box-containing protein
MATTSPEKVILEVNDEICRILGYERDELLQKSWAELTHPDDLAADVAQFNRVLAGEMDGYTLDKRWIRGDGRVIDTILAANCSRRADGSVDYFVGLILDATERKHAQERLRRSEAYLAEGQRLCHTGSWAWNVSTGNLFWSDEHFRIFGLNPETARPAYEMFLRTVHAEDRSPLRQNFERTVGDNADFDAQYRIVRPDGTIRFIHSLAHPVFSAGEVTEYVGTVVDITERVTTEEQLRNLHGELAHLTRLTTAGELAAAIAHEVNQPLGAIVNNASVARDLASAGTKVNRRELNETLSDIVTDANRAAAIIARIRGLMKHATPKREELQLGDVVKDVVALTRRELAENRISVRIEVPEDLPRVSADRVQMQQVLFNLTMNAIEAMSMAQHSARVLTFAARSDDRNGTPAVLVSVSDVGAGFNVEDEERLFEAFYTTKPDGLGMGLRISRSIVEAHGGRLWAQLNSDEGATLFFYLPAESGVPL